MDKLKVIINKANIVHENKYDYSRIKIYTKMIDKYEIICKTHGVFTQSLHKHLQGDGCKECSNKVRGISKSQSSKEKFIIDANRVHENKYDYLKTTYEKAVFPVIVTCKLHGDFRVTPNKHLGGVGCKHCSKENKKKALMYPLDKFLDEVKNIHGDKYDYSKVIWEGVDKNIIVICKIHGEFKIRALTHRTKGCFLCEKQPTHKNMLTLEQFISKHKTVHGDFYDYSNTRYKGLDKYVNVECKKHGEFSFIGSNMTGCKKCRMKKFNESIILSGKNKLINELCKKNIINNFIKVHGNLYDYSKVNYINTTTKVEIYCKTHGYFLCSPANHLRGKGCRSCKHTHSKKCIDWLKYRSIIDNCYIRSIAYTEGEYRIPNTKYKADGYCETTNTIYEFYGTVFHGDPRYTDHSKNNFLGKNYGILYNKTIERETVIKELGYNIISIWENDWDFIAKKIKNFDIDIVFKE